MAKKQKKTFKNAGKNPTLSLLSKKVDGLADTVDKLAIITRNGFENVDKRFEHIEKRLDGFEKGNTREHEEIKIRQDNVAYRFEVVELEKRVETLEKKIS